MCLQLIRWPQCGVHKKSGQAHTSVLIDKSLAACFLCWQGGSESVHPFVSQGAIAACKGPLLHARMCCIVAVLHMPWPLLSAFSKSFQSFLAVDAHGTFLSWPLYLSRVVLPCVCLCVFHLIGAVQSSATSMQLIKHHKVCCRVCLCVPACDRRASAAC